jgi:hypothetical protein
MVSPAISTHLPTLELSDEREPVGLKLQATLHELVDLSLIGKQLHWAVEVGRLFRPLHLQLDELVDSGVSSRTRSPSGRSLSASCQTGRRTLSRPARRCPRSRRRRSRTTSSCAS